MREVANLVSVIIPAYNAASFIEETIQSVFTQTYKHWEIIIVNDGSTDTTAEIIHSFNDSRIISINQENAGVAAARNKGLLHATGEFIVFFDADDLMSPGFLSVRVNALKRDPAVGYVGGFVKTFPAPVKIRKAAASDPVNEILFFNSAFVTVPSNYMIRKGILTNSGILFNILLSSSADRFFILEISKHTKGKNISDLDGQLLYRFTNQSMSNKVTPGLIIDNEKFYYELKKKNLLPDEKKQQFKSFYFLSLAKGFGMIKYRKMVLKYLIMSFVNDPFFFTKNFGKSIFNFSLVKGFAKSA